ncbi:MAG: peptidase family protein [Acidimicrobiia bacterium]|nr:peptidase family protein [Acidimicrobiia bacterium]
MFPLGLVLVPSMMLPLRIFEPRYQEMVRACVASNGEFGVVLIARGSEVGGGDVRYDIGTVAQIMGLQPRTDGGFHISALGVRRIMVEEWLPDDPYPRALVSDYPELEPEPDFAERHAANVVLMRRVLALAAELGDPAPPATVDIVEDPVAAGYQMASLAGLGPADLYELLREPGPSARAERLLQMLGDQRLLLEMRLAELGGDR